MLMRVLDYRRGYNKLSKKDSRSKMSIKIKERVAG